MTNDDALQPGFDTIQKAALAVGVIGAAFLVFAGFVSTEQALQSYLFGYMFWLALALGSLGVLFLHHLVSGNWGYAIQRVLEAASRTLPLMALLFIPILFGMPRLYPWAREGWPSAGDVLAFKEGYLTTHGFIIRAVIYFGLWIGGAFLMSRWSLRQDKNGDAGLTRKMKILSAPGLILYFVTMTFASVDWLMSLEPMWSSSIYGFIVTVGQGLSTFAFAIIVVWMLAKYKPFSGFLTERHYHHLGNMLLTCTILWAYMEYSQLIIIWSGNLPDETSWYAHRLSTAWDGLALFVVVAHFFIPFFLLLSRRSKRHLPRLAAIAAFVLVMRIFDYYWEISPAFSPLQLRVHWLDAVAPLAIGGVWIWAFIRQLKAQPLLALHDPRFSPTRTAGEEDE